MNEVRNHLILLNRKVGGGGVNYWPHDCRAPSSLKEVLDETTLSDKQCMEFSSQERSQTVDKGRGSKKEGTPPGT